MKILYEESFGRDLDDVRNQKVRDRIVAVIERIKKAELVQGIPNLKKLQGYKNLFRIRIGNYRLGIEISDNVVTLLRFKHRKDIYDVFPPP